MCQKELNILWLTSWYPNRYDPLYGSFIKRQAEATSKFCNIGLIYAVESKEDKYEINIEETPFLQIIVYFPQSHFLPLKWVRYFKALLKGYNLYSQKMPKPALAHVQIGYPVGIFALYLKWVNRIPFIISEHSTFHKKWYFKKLEKAFFSIKYISKLIFNKAQRIVALSDNHAQILQSIGLGKKFSTIPNVVDTDIFSLKPAKKISEKAVCQFLHVSLLSDAHKNPKGILNAIAILQTQRTDFTFTFIGDDSLHKHLIDYAKSKKINPQLITFRGYIPSKDVATAMQEADVFVLFSNFEGLPCVILEAMSVGLPIIATETGGINEWINEKTGYLLDVGDEKGLVAALNFMIENYSRFSTEHIRKAIVQTCSHDVVGQNILSIYADILNKSI